MKQDLKIVKVKIEDLKFAEYNPRMANKKDVDDLKKSLEEFGFAEPIVVNSAPKRKNVIIGGHFRTRVAQEMGMKEVPVVYVNIPDEMKERELNLRLNKNVGQWDWDMLANFDEDELKNVGFDSDELDKVFNLDMDEDEKDDAIPEVPKEPISKLGDIYQLGDHRLLCGDATKEESFKKLLGDSKVRLCFTSPPYNMAGGMYRRYADNLKSEKYIDFNLTVIGNIKKYLNGFIFWNVSYNKNSRWEFLEILYRIAKESGLRFLELIIWDKGHGLPINSKEGLTRSYEDILLMGDEDSFKKDIEIYSLGTTEGKAYFNKKSQKGITNYWRIGTNKTQIKDLKACFPVALPKRGILLMTDRGNGVLDPFGGSGSTLIACEKLGRKCYMMELDNKYVDVIINRYCKYINNYNIIKNGKPYKWETKS